jgi:ABC-2 type transport system permease protein
VIEEKNSRVVELVLSSINATEMMSGKILGASITALLQMMVWLSPIVIVVGFSLPILPVELSLQLSPGLTIYYLYNFFIGLITFLGLFATVGSIFNNVQESQSGTMPLMMVIIVPFLITLSLIKNPNNALAAISSMLPFASIMVMPSRMVLTDVPLWQIGLSNLVNILTIMLLFPVAGKIYRIGILKTGKKPTWAEFRKWIKEKN